MPDQPSRRRFLSFCGAVALAGSSFCRAFADEKSPRFRIGICDWDLAAAGDPKSFETAKQLGFEGVQVSFRPDGDWSLAEPANRRLFLDAARKNGVQIASLAMGFLNDRPLADKPEAEGWVESCLEAMTDMNVDRVLLAFFSKGDIKDNPDARKIVVEKLRRLAPIAEKRKKILALESYLDASEHLKILDAVGSDAVKVYYDEQNMSTKGYPIYDDMEMLLKAKAICELHAKEYDARLGEGKIDFRRIRDLLETYDYRGWIVVESSVKGDWKESQAANAAYLKKTFLP